MTLGDTIQTQVHSVYKKRSVTLGAPHDSRQQHTKPSEHSRLSEVTKRQEGSGQTATRLNFAPKCCVAKHFKGSTVTWKIQILLNNMEYVILNTTNTFKTSNNDLTASCLKYRCFFEVNLNTQYRSSVRLWFSISLEIVCCSDPELFSLCASSVEYRFTCCHLHCNFCNCPFVFVYNRIMNFTPLLLVGWIRKAF